MQGTCDVFVQAGNDFGSSRQSGRNRVLALMGKCSRAVSLLFLISLSSGVRAKGLQSADYPRLSDAASQAGLMAKDSSTRTTGSDESAAAKSERADPMRKLIVIGFMGGNVSATNLAHREAQLIKALQHGYPHAIHAAIFANRDGDNALRSVLGLLDQDQDGRLSDDEKSAARIVIFGHSWGASETVTLADRLNRLDIPVLLTVQVDSVRKQSQNDRRIPPNVQEAVNFYQSEGILHGRNLIVAVDPNRTKILGNHESRYRQNPVSCAGYPWYARAFMKRHIQIENDPAVWNQIEALILAKVL